jgi:predicted dehydrogenase
VAREFNAIALDGFRAMLNREDIDAILSLAPDWVGPLPILAACEARKSIYSSAALDIAPEQASEIKRRVEAAGIAFMAELPRRFSPATLRLKELIATRLGKPRLLFCHERRRCEHGNEPYRGRHCPTIMRNFMELVDWCRYIVGKEPETVGGICHSHVNDSHHQHHRVSEYQMVSLQFPGDDHVCNNVTAQISIGHYIPPTWPDALSYRRPASLQVCCEHGIAFVDLPSTLVWFDESGQHNESLELDRPVGEQMLTHFHRAVTSLVRRTSDLEDAYRALRIVSTAQKSFDQQCRLKIEY